MSIGHLMSSLEKSLFKFFVHFLIGLHWEEPTVRVEVMVIIYLVDECCVKWKLKVLKNHHNYFEIRNMFNRNVCVCVYVSA